LAAAAAGQELPKKERGLANLLQKKFRQALTFLRCLMRSVPSPNILADLLFRHVTFGLLSLKDPGRGNPAEKPSENGLNAIRRRVRWMRLKIRTNPKEFNGRTILPEI
jgi:hypothetical protein